MARKEKKKEKASKLIKQIGEHLKGDVEGFEHEKKEDKALLKKIYKKNKKRK